MNKVIMMGRIASDLELKTTPNGVTVCSFRLAVDRNYQKKGEEKATDFFNVVAWRATAEFIAKWFVKGKMLLIEGEMQTRQYTDKNGNPATWYEVVVEKAYFTGEKNEAPSPQTTAQTAPRSTVHQQTAPQAQNVRQPTVSQPQQEAPPLTDNDEYPF